MTTSEKRLLAWFVLATATAATLLHWATKEEAPVVEAAPQPPVSVEATFLASVAGATTEPTSPPGAWRVTWRGAPSDLWPRLRAAEKAPGGYFVTSMDLREVEARVWQLEVVAAPWHEGLTAPTIPVDVTPVVEKLGWTPPRRTEPAPAARSAPAPLAAPAPAGPTGVTGALVLLGSYGGGAGMHWWLKEKATDRVFAVPGAEDWTLVQADGAALVLQRAGVLYRVELTP